MKKIHLILILILSVLKTIFSQQLFPHIIWLYWKKGYENLGGFQKLCVNRVICLHANTDWEVHFLDQKRISLWLNQKNYQQLRQFLNPKLKVTEQTRANFIRYYLLKQHGGVWLDVSIVLFQNLNWLDHLYQNPKVIHKNIFKKPEIFLFYKHQGDISQQKKMINYEGQNIYPLLNVQNSMIAAVKQSQFMNDLIDQYKMLIRPNGRNHFYSRKSRYHFSYAYSSYFRAFLANNIIQFKKFTSYLDQAYKQNVSNIQNNFYGILTMNRKYQMYHLSQFVWKMNFAFESQGSRGDYANYFAKYHHFSTQQVIRNVFSGNQSNIQKSQKVVDKTNYLSGQQYLRPEYDCLYKLQVRQDSVLNKYLLLQNKKLTNDIYPNVKVIYNKNLPLICKVTSWKTLRKIGPILEEWTYSIIILFILIQFILQYLIFSFKSSQIFIIYFQGKERFKSQTFRVLILLIAIYLQKDLIHYQYQLWLEKSPTAIRVGIFESVFTLLMIFWISFESSKVKIIQQTNQKSFLRKHLYKFSNFQLSFCSLMLIQYFVQYSFTVWKYEGEIYNYEILTDLNRQKLIQGEMHLMKVISMVVVKIFIQLLKFVFRLNIVESEKIKDDIMIQQSNHICRIEDGSQTTFFQRQPNCFVINSQKQNSF